ncbi:MAG: peptide-N-glycosidase F-related protein [Bacteroidota bacterium]
MKKTILLLTIPCLAISMSFNAAYPQDTTYIISHDQVKVVTDPTKGVNSYPAQVTFPAAGQSVRKINILVTFQCPDGLQCGEWDYIDYINLKGTDQVTGKDFNYEIARLITPYGRFFGTKWFFTFKAGITDFSSLLRNKAIVEYVHSGYESDKTCGWKISVKFEFISGPPVANALSVEPMWNGQFPYGDTLKPIEKNLDVRNVQASEKTRLLRLRVIQTGHGMDREENCAEFCTKYRDILFDGKVAGHRDIWMKCGTNPVYPQAGTWIYDRANWCPGCMVNPEHFDLFVEPGTSHTVDINMEPYIVTHGEATANYVFCSFLIQYDKPRATNDAAIEEILAPSVHENFSRMNPIGYDSKILIKNNGTQPLKSLKIEYGLAGQKPMVYNWTGNLAFGKSEEIYLPGILNSDKEADLFTVVLSKPNGKTDQYSGDNRMTSVMIAPPVYPSKFILICKTNRDSSQTAWKITDATGKVWYQKKEEELKENTEYKDTLSLSDGHYTLLVTDKGGDGLEFWANPRAGMGYVRLASTDGKLIKAFGSDFGNEIFQSFTVDSKKPGFATQDAMVLAYPHRPTQNTTLMLHFNQPQTVTGRLTTQDGKALQQLIWYEVTQGNFLIDLSNYPDGIYMLELKYGDQTESIRLKKAGMRR